MAADDKPEGAQPGPGPGRGGAAREDRIYGEPPGVAGWRRIVRTSLLIILVVYTVLFFLWNRENVDVSLVVTTVNVPLVWVLLGTFLLGAAVMYLLLYLRKRAARKAKASDT